MSLISLLPLFSLLMLPLRLLDMRRLPLRCLLIRALILYAMFHAMSYVTPDIFLLLALPRYFCFDTPALRR